MPSTGMRRRRAARACISSALETFSAVMPTDAAVAEAIGLDPLKNGCTRVRENSMKLTTTNAEMTSTSNAIRLVFTC